MSSNADAPSSDPLTPRQASGQQAVHHEPGARELGAHEVGAREAGAAAEEPAPIYGAGVPYGGDDRTEEIDPIALDMPFEHRANAAARAVPPKAISASSGLRDFAMNVPVTQLALSDLFDSTPESGLMAPPDPAAFSSSRPPPPELLSSSGALAGSAGVVAMPNITIGSAAARAEAVTVARASVRAPVVQPVMAPPPVAPPAPAAPPTPLQEDDDLAKRRQSVPTLESAVHPTPVPVSASPASPQPLTAPPASSEIAGAEAASVQAPGADEIPRFASEIPTSRPPDVILAPGRAAGPALRPLGRALEPPQSAVTAPAPTNQSVTGQLPSIILAQDVEAEPDVLQRRALRAGRATVRIELPQDFMRPGSPLHPGLGQPGAERRPSAVPVEPEQPRRSSPATVMGTGFAQPGAAQPALPTGLGGLQTKRVLWIMAAAALLVTALILLLQPSTGSLVVTALGPGNRAVDNVQIFVGDLRCDTSPCRISGLQAGVHKLSATAPGLASREDEAVEIRAGEEATYNIDLLGAEPEVKAGGLRMGAAGRDLTLYVDGKRVGKLPQTVSGLAGGKHWIKLDPEDGGPAIEKAVTILAGEMVEVDPNPAKRDKALVTIRLSPGSEGASVTLDDAFLLDFPAELELEPKSVHTLSASKPGYEDFSMDVQVEEGESEKLIEVSLTPLDGASPPRRSRPKAARKPSAAKAAPAATSADATQGLLNISSVPPSQIILNGRPLGSTPKMGIAVPGDSLQTIVFVHPKMGRRRAQKFVPAGKQRTVSIRF
jgi:serine/threonine-protein kinase